MRGGAADRSGKVLLLVQAIQVTTFRRRCDKMGVFCTYEILLYHKGIWSLDSFPK